MKLDPLKLKYARFYWNVADAAEMETIAQRHTVGAVAITPSGIMLSGWNGTVPGADNCCETGEMVYDEELKAHRRKTGPLVLHAENNIIGKAVSQGISLSGAHLYVTRAPCLACSRMLMPTGISHVFYGEEHDDNGLDALRKAGIEVTSRYEQMKLFDQLYPPPQQLRAKDLFDFGEKLIKQPK